MDELKIFNRNKYKNRAFGILRKMEKKYDE